MEHSVSDVLVALEAEAQLLKLERLSSASYHEACVSFSNKAKNELADIQTLLKGLLGAAEYQQVHFWLCLKTKYTPHDMRRLMAVPA